MGGKTNLINYYFMDHAELRKAMDKSLKSIVVSKLKAIGFTGNYPHLRRFNKENIDVWGFQFSQWSPAFLIEIGSSPLTGITTGGSHYPPEKIKYYECLKRERVGEYDYKFDRGNFDEISNKVLECIPQAENWWLKNSA